MSKTPKDYRLQATEALSGVALAGKLPQATDDEMLDALTDLRHFAWMVDYDQREIVKHLRLSGATWQAIGDALQVSRSAAQQRFGA